MALSLAACGGSSTPVAVAPVVADPVVPVVPVVDAAKALVLTIGADAATGGSGSDTISGARIDTIQTWNSADKIAAGEGTDSLTAVITANVTPAAGGVTGVENITVTNINAAGAVDLTVTFSTATVTGISGVTNVSNLASTDGLTFARLVDLAEVTINNTAAATVVTYADTVLAGTADAVTLNVNSATGAINIGNATTGAGTGIETLNIATSGGLSQFDATNVDASVTTVKVTGSGALDINAAAAFASVGVFNGAAATGDIDVTFLADGVTGATNTKTITTGSGSDEIDISAIDPATVGAVSVTAGAGNDTVVVGARGAADYTIVGGDGSDIISVGAAASAALHGGISGFEKLYVTAGQAQDLLLYTGSNAFTTLRADAASVDFSNVAAGATTLEVTSNATTLASVARLVDGSADALTVKSATAAGVTTVTLTVDDAETLNFDTNTGALTINTAFNAEDATSITVVGDNAVDLGVYAATTASLATFDASGMTAAANATLNAAASTVAMTVTGNAATTYTGVLNVTTGSGNDTITGGNGADVLTSGAGNDTISGGAGADTITGGDGSDNLTGGAGVDIFTFGVAATGVDTVMDFTRNSTGGTSDDRIAIDILAAAGADATAVHEANTGAIVLNDGDVLVVNGNAFVDTSGNAAADLTAIKAAAGGTTLDASSDALAIFKADTNGDGTADAVQVWLLTTAAGDTVIDTAQHLATLSGYSTSADLAGDFLVAAFDL